MDQPPPPHTHTPNKIIDVRLWRIFSLAKPWLGRIKKLGGPRQPYAICKWGLS